LPPFFWCYTSTLASPKEARALIALQGEVGRGLIYYFLKSVNQGSAHVVDEVGGLSIVKLEDRLNGGNFRSSSVQAAEGDPVIYDETSTNNVRTSVDGSVCDGDLKKSRKLIHILDGALGVHKSTLVGKSGVRADESMSANSLSENLNTKNVVDDLLGLSVDIRVNQSHVIVGDDDVSESAETLLNSLYDYAVWQSVSDVLHLLVCGCVGEEETASVSWLFENKKQMSATPCCSINFLMVARRWIFVA
jgi:hypothetical protein